METYVFSEIINKFGNLIKNGVDKVIVGILALYLILCVIDIIVAILFSPGVGLEGIFKMLIKKGINISVMVAIISGWNTFIPLSLGIFIHMGNLFGTGDFQAGNDINSILTFVGTFVDSIWDKATINIGEIFKPSIANLNFEYSLMLILCACATFLGYIYIITMVILTILEYLLVGGLSIILLPFAGFEAIKSIAQKTINTIISLGTRVMVTVALCSMAIDEIGHIPIELLRPEDFHPIALLTWLGKAILISYCVVNIPKLVQSLLTGNGNALTVSGLKGFVTQGAAYTGAGVGAAIGNSEGSLKAMFTSGLESLKAGDSLKDIIKASGNGYFAGHGLSSMIEGSQRGYDAVEKSLHPLKTLSNSYRGYEQENNKKDFTEKMKDRKNEEIQQNKENDNKFFKDIENIKQEVLDSKENKNENFYPNSYYEDPNKKIENNEEDHKTKEININNILENLGNQEIILDVNSLRNEKFEKRENSYDNDYYNKNNLSDDNIKPSLNNDINLDNPSKLSENNDNKEFLSQIKEPIIQRSSLDDNHSIKDYTETEKNYTTNENYIGKSASEANVLENKNYSNLKMEENINLINKFKNEEESIRILNSDFNSGANNKNSQKTPDIYTQNQKNYEEKQTEKIKDFERIKNIENKLAFKEDKDKTSIFDKIVNKNKEKDS